MKLNRRAFVLPTYCKMENKFKEGEIVFASSHPMLELTVISIIEGHYHCRVQAEPTRQELVYLESDLSSFSTVEVAAEEVGGSC